MPRSWYGVPAWAALTALTIAGSVAAQGMSLTDAARLARARAERQRPAQEAALKPFLPELRLDYWRNQEVLDGTIEKVAALDGVVPLLLEYLTPADESRDARRLAANSARVLARLDPLGWLDALVELAQGEHPVARQQAIFLLGHADHPRARATLLEVYERLSDPYDRQVALRAAGQLGEPGLVQAAATALGATEPELRREALVYLRTVGGSAAKDAVLQALAAEPEHALLPFYVDYLAAAVRADTAAAAALLPLVQGVRLDPTDQVRTIEALATVAPEGHEETRRVLFAILESGDTARRGVAAALTLKALGDRRGQRLLFETLDDKLRRNRDSADLHADRADAFCAFGEWREAIRDYEQAIRISRHPQRKAALWLHVARCEAHRDNPRRLAYALKEAHDAAPGYGVESIRREAARDPVFEAALGNDTVQRFLQSLDR